MPTDTYELARQIVDAAPTTQFALTDYTGGTQDLAYLKQWVLDQVTEIYGVDPTVFDAASLVSTSILRDFVHRALYQTTTPDDIYDIAMRPEFLGWGDVALGFRYPAFGLCGFMSWQMYQVYRAFGYKTSEISTTNPNDPTWRDGHVFTEVYVEDLGKSIVQDATFNFIYRDDADAILSFTEARDILATGGHIEFDCFTYYRWYEQYGTSWPQLDERNQNYIRDNYLKLVYWWWNSEGIQTFNLLSLFPNPESAHAALSDQGGVFANTSDAQNLIASLLEEGKGWQNIAADLRDAGYYTTAFAPIASDGSNASEWITVRLASGDYISIDLHTRNHLNGSFDQLVGEATGSPALNPDVDLRAFLAPVHMIGFEGKFMRAGSDSSIHSGGAGNDTYWFWTDTDTAIEQVDGGIDGIYSFVSVTLPENIEIVHLLGDAVQVAGNSGEYWLHGNDIDNVILASQGRGHLHGEAGDDLYFVDAAGSRVVELTGEGNDTVITSVSLVLEANSEVETLKTYGSMTTQALDLTGSNTANILVGNNGANVIDGRGGTDTMWGYGGNDTFYVDNSADKVVELAGGGHDQVVTSVTFSLDPTSEVELIKTYSSSSTQVIDLTGSNTPNTMVGNAAGNILDGRGGADSMWGYGGNDTYYVDDSGDRVIEFANGGVDTIFTNVSVALDPTSEVENLMTYGSLTAQAINLIGSNSANTLVGNAAANIIDGRGGADVMWGFGGDDTYYVDDIGDTVMELTGGGNDTIIASVSVSLDPASEVETLKTYGSSTATVVHFTGSDTANTLIGNAAANILDGRAGADLMWGFSGNDTYYIDNVADRAVEATDGGIDTIVTRTSFSLESNSEIEILRTYGSATTHWIDLIGNRYDNTILGNAGTNTLAGMGGDDTIWAYAGDDRIAGGMGNDILTGGVGADRFIFDTALDAAANVDCIKDYQCGVDAIELDRSIFAALQQGILPDSAFVIDNRSRTPEQRIIYDSSTGSLYYDADGNNATAMIQFALLSKGLQLTHDDIIIA